MSSRERIRRNAGRPPRRSRKATRSSTRCGRRRGRRRPCATAIICRTGAPCRWGSISRRSTGSSLASTASTAAAIATGRHNGSRRASSTWSAAARRWRAVTRETAGQMLLSAAVCYHLAGYMHPRHRPPAARDQASMLRAVEIYWEAAPHFSPPSVPVEDSVRRHDAAAVPAAAARTWSARRASILIGGANSNMINMHAVSEYYLDRGMAALGLDGPGQGEFRARTGRALARQGLRSCAERGSRLARAGRPGRRQAASASTGGPPGRCWRSMRPPATSASRPWSRIPARSTSPISSSRPFAQTLVSHRLEMCVSWARKTLEEGDASRPRAADARRRGGSGGFPDPVGMLGRRRDDADD